MQKLVDSVRLYLGGLRQLPRNLIGSPHLPKIYLSKPKADSSQFSFPSSRTDALKSLYLVAKRI